MMRFLYMLAAIGRAQRVALETQRKIDLHEAKIRERRELTQAKIARENNIVVLQDIEIERRKLELAEIEKRVNPPDWGGPLS